MPPGHRPAASRRMPPPIAPSDKIVSVIVIGPDGRIVSRNGGRLIRRDARCLRGPAPDEALSPCIVHHRGGDRHR